MVPWFERPIRVSKLRRSDQKVLGRAAGSDQTIKQPGNRYPNWHRQADCNHDTSERFELIRILVTWVIFKQRMLSGTTVAPSQTEQPGHKVPLPAGLPPFDTRGIARCQPGFAQLLIEHLSYDFKWSKRSLA
jgi:hypothetical protein